MRQDWIRRGVGAVLLGVMLIGGICRPGATAPQAKAELTWKALMVVQATERAQMKQAQSEQLQKLVEVQKEEFQTMAGNAIASGVQLAVLANKNSDERKEIAKIFAEERAALAKTHADERKAWFSLLRHPRESAQGAS